MSVLFEVSKSLFLPWLLLSSLQASLLILIVLAVLKVTGKRLDPRWHCVLWLLVLVRMALPWSPPSPLSVHNVLARLPVGSSAVDGNVATVPLSDGDVSRAEAGVEGDTTADSNQSSVKATHTFGTEPSAAVGAVSFYQRTSFWCGLWLTGASVVSLMLIWNKIGFWRALKGNRPVTDSVVLELLEDCKECMGVQTFLAIVPAPRMQTPALYGFIRPRLLMPPAMLKQLPREQLRHVLLHELAHLKRMDIHLGWLASILQVLHWFNPLVWLALSRMREARELACDQKVLAVLQPSESQAYGTTILNLLEHWTQPRRIPGMAGILEERSQLKRRITMIAGHRGDRRIGSMAGVALAGVLALVGLTNAQQTPSAAIEDKVAKSVNATPTPAESTPTETQEEAIVQVEKLGGKVAFHGPPGRAFASVTFMGPKVKDNALVHLERLPALQQVALIDTRVSDAGLAHLEGLADLRILMLSSPLITDSGLVHLSKLLELRTLVLQVGEVTDAGLAQLQGLTELESLTVSGAEITDASLATITKFSQLQSLSLLNTGITDAALQQFGTMTALRTLYLGSPKITDAGLGHLQTLTHLIGLGLTGTQVSDAGLAQLKAFPRLQFLSLSDSTITDAGLVHVQGLAHLQSLDLRAAKVTDEGVKTLQQALPKCKIGR